MLTRNWVKQFKKVLETINIASLSIADIIFLVNKNVPRKETISTATWNKLIRKFKTDPKSLNDIQFDAVSSYATKYVELKQEYYSKMVDGDAQEFKKYKELYDMVNGKIRPINVLEDKEEEKKISDSAIGLLANILEGVSSALPDRLKHKELDAKYEVLDE